MSPELEKIILKLTNSHQILGVDLLQNLWRGYGALNRVITENTSVIVKLIQFPKPEHEAELVFSHHRKIKSYAVEAYWYQYYNSVIDSAYSPRLLASGVLKGQEHYLILEDLRTLGFRAQKSLIKTQVEQCLTWLAHFHSHYLNQSPTHLWQTGTYWHLSTRPY